MQYGALGIQQYLNISALLFFFLKQHNHDLSTSLKTTIVTANLEESSLPLEWSAFSMILAMKMLIYKNASVNGIKQPAGLSVMLLKPLENTEMTNTIVWMNLIEVSQCHV